MSDDVAIKVENISKKYTKSLKRSMLYGLEDISRNSLGIKSRNEILRKDEFWAVDDVSFEVKKGESLGIIGSNGSGKTTILKMLNGIFWPNKGKITIAGNVGALIAVGAGFHPLLTGRENVFLNAAILGMDRKEAQEKYEEIVEFSEIGDFIESPVKYYSSGMYVRLGFAVAAHLEPEVLLIDEVLAVGDLAFALKCHRKMSELRQKGRTVVLVSHNMQGIRNICKKVVWIEKGKIQDIGDVQNVCDKYEEEVIRQEEKNDERGRRLEYDPKVKISNLEFFDKDNKKSEEYEPGDRLKIRMYFECQRKVERPIFNVIIYNDLRDLAISSNSSNFDGYEFEPISGKGYVDFYLDNLNLRPSKYSISCSISEKENRNILSYHDKVYSFIVAGNSTNFGIINLFPKWELNKENNVKKITN